MRQPGFAGGFLLAFVVSLAACAPDEVEREPAAAAPARSNDDSAARIAAIVDPLIESDLAESGIPGAAFVFVRDGRIVYQRGYGVSDVATRARVDPETTVWPIASVTKAITALAVMQVVDAAKVDLDTDVNRYLKRVQVPDRGYGPLTLRHLLSHTAALDEIPGRQFDGKARPDMAAFVGKRLMRYRPPGKWTAYSTYGMALAAIVLEDVSGEPYAGYLQRHVFEPASMTHSWIMTVRGDEKGVATPYEIEDGRAQPIDHEWYVTTPTSSMVATVSDMGRLLLVYLSEGKAGAQTVLSPELIRAMETQQATNHPDVPGWGLGLQLDRVNDVAIAEHGGDIGGFASLFVLLPETREGFYIVHHGEGGDLRFRVKQALLDALHPAREPPTVPAANPANAQALAEYAGPYLSSIACRSCKERDDPFVVTAEPDGTLGLWGQKWVPLRHDLFIRDDGKRLLGFGRDEKGRIATVTGGSWRVADRIQ